MNYHLLKHARHKRTILSFKRARCSFRSAQGVLLAPGQSETLNFEMPMSTSLATVLENGDRVFFPGEYTVTFSRGHGANLTKQVVVAAALGDAAGSTAPVMLTKFPSRWVDGAKTATLRSNWCFLRLSRAGSAVYANQQPFVGWS